MLEACKNYLFIKKLNRKAGKKNNEEEEKLIKGL